MLHFVKFGMRKALVIRCDVVLGISGQCLPAINHAPHAFHPGKRLRGGGVSGRSTNNETMLSSRIGHPRFNTRTLLETASRDKRIKVFGRRQIGATEAHRLPVPGLGSGRLLNLPNLRLGETYAPEIFFGEKTLPVVGKSVMHASTGCKTDEEAARC